METEKKRENGFVLFVVLIFIVVTSLLGAGLYMASKQNTENQSAYFQKATSIENARSGVDWFATLLNVNSDKVVSFMKSNANGSHVWYVGDGTSWEWSTSQKKSVKMGNHGVAIIEVFNIDTSLSMLTLKVTAQGIGGSVKTINAILKIEGAGLLTSKDPKFSCSAKHALYIESSMQSVNEKLDIDGDFYAGGKTIFNDGSVVNGDTKIISAGGNDVIVNNNVTFNGSVYIDGDLNLNDNLKAENGDYFYVEGATQINNNTEFGSKTYLAGGFGNINGTIDFKKDAFIAGNNFSVNKQIDADGNLNVNTGINNFNDKLVMHGTDAKFRDNESSALSNGKIVLANGATAEMNTPVAVPSAADLGIDNKREQEVSADYSGLTVNFKLSDLDKQAGDGNFYENNMKNNFSSSFWEDMIDDGTASLNNHTFSASNLDKNNGTLVVLVDEDIGNFKPGDFNSGNVVFVIDGATVNAGNNFWNVDDGTDGPSSPSVGIIVTDDGKMDNFGGNGKFRGFVWDSSSNRGNYSTFTNGFDGSMIIKGDDGFNINNGPGTSMNIKFDENALQPFADLGVFKDPTSGGSTTSTVQSSDFDKIANIRTRIISKY